MEALSTLIAFSETIVISLAEMSESFVLGFGCLSTHLELYGFFWKPDGKAVGSYPIFGSIGVRFKMPRKECAYLKSSVSMTLLLRQKIISKTAVFDG